MSAYSHALIQASSIIGGAFVMSPERREVPMPPVMDDAPSGRIELEEALRNLAATARAADKAGDVRQHERHHARINARLSEWEAARELVPA